MLERDERIQNEIRHGKFLLRNDPEGIWHWNTSAGKLRKRRRVGFLNESIEPKHRVLEIGCGIGNFTKDISTTGADITAIDISPELIRKAENLNPQTNVTYNVKNAYDSEFPENHFDFVIGSSVLHHLEINDALNEFYRVLKKGGVIKFTEPNMLNPQIFIERNVPFMRKLFNNSPDETAFIRFLLQKKLKKAGFCSVKIYPFDFLHPATPKLFIKCLIKMGKILERVPIFKEFAGSLYIEAQK